MIGKELTRKQKLQLFTILLIAAVIVIAALYSLLVPREDQDTHTVYKAETVLLGDVVQGVMENGSLSLQESSVTYDLTLEEEEDEDDEEEEEESTVKYLTIDEIYVVTGERITAGDPLFSFSEKSIEAVRKRIESRLNQAKIALDQANAEYQTSILSAENTYHESMQKSNNASNMRAASVSLLEQEINSLQSEIAVLELEINQCLEGLTEEDFLESYNDAVLAFENASSDLEETDKASAAAYSGNFTEYQTAKQQYDSILSQKEQMEQTIADNQEKILQNQLDIQSLQSKLETELLDVENTYALSVESGALAQEIYEYTKNSLSGSVEEAEKTYQEVSSLMEELEAFIGEDGIVYAEENGMVTGIFYEAGDELVRNGDVITYVKTDDYTISVDVSEEDIANIGINDSVQVTFDAYPDEDFDGTVTAITTTKTSDHANTVSYPVTILVSGNTEKLYGGMTAGITFVTEQVQDVLYVSKKAIVESDGKSYVYIEDSNGEKILTEVETGFENSTLIEIKEGLSEGDTIYIKSQATEEIE